MKKISETEDALDLHGLCAPLMSQHLEDLDHDQRWLSENPGVPFVHVTRRSGTHIFPMPCANALREDRAQPHLFSEARPSQIYAEDLRCLTGELRESAVQWLVFDGRRIKATDADQAASLYRSFLAKAQRLAVRESRTKPPKTPH